MEQKKKPIAKSVLSILLALAMVLGAVSFMPGSMVVQADSSDRFRITVADNIRNGSINVAQTANVGQEVYVTVNPNDGYELISLVVTFGVNNNKCDVTYDAGSKRYSFTMPVSNVTISAEFGQRTEQTTEQPPEDATYISKDFMLYRIQGNAESIVGDSISGGRGIVELEKDAEYVIMQSRYYFCILDAHDYVQSAPIPCSGDYKLFSDRKTIFSCNDSGKYCISITESPSKKIYITKVPMDDWFVVVDDVPDQEYGVRPTPGVWAGETKLMAGTDYKYEYSFPANGVGANASVSIKFLEDFNKLRTVTKTFKVIPRTVSNPTIEIAEAAYTGAALEPEVTVRDGNTVIDPSEYTVSYSNNTNPALSTDTNAPTVTITDKEGGNYIVNGSKTFTIAKPAEITAAPTASAITYGQSLSDSTLTGGAATGDGVALEGSFSWTKGSIKPAVSDSNATEYEVTFTPTDTNYGKVTTKVKVTVNKGSNPAQVTDTASVARDGNTVDLAGNVVLNGAAGTVSYAISGDAKGCTLNGSVLTSGADTGSVTVNVSVAADDNYEALPEKTITVTITDKSTQTLTFDSDAVTKTYGDASFTNTLSGGQTAITYAVTAGTDVAEINSSSGAVTIKKAGTATITATASESERYAGASASYSLTVNKKAVTVKADDKSMVVGAATEPELTATVSGLVSGESESLISYSIDREAGTDIGTYTITPSGDAEQGNYAVTYETGTITITNIPTYAVTVNSGSGSGSYAANETVTITADTAPQGKEFDKWTTADGVTFADANAATTTFTMPAKAVAVTANYKDILSTTTDPVITKTPAAISSLVYDGTAKALVSAGEATGGTFYYALGDVNSATKPYTISIPTGTDAGTYYVWYKAKGNDTYSDSTPACVIVTIASSTPTPPTPVTPDPEPTPTSDPIPAPDPTPTPAPAEQVTIPVENETSIQVTADVTDGNARIGEIYEDDIAKVTGSEGSQAQNTDDTAIVIDVSGAQQEVKSVEISSTTLQLLAETAASGENKIDKVEIKLSNASVVLDATTLQAISSQAQGDNIRLVVDDTNVQTLTARQQETLSQLNTVQTFEAYFESNGVRIGDFKGGTAEVSMPFTPEPGKDISHYFLVYVAEDGTITRCATVITTDSLVSILPHFSDYAIIYDEAMTNDTEILDKTWQNYSSVEAELCIKVRGDAQGTAQVTTTAQGTAIIDQILTTGTDKTLVIDQVYYHGQYYKVQGIAAAAAKGNKEIRTLKVGKDVEKIGKKAFAGCKNLKKVKLTASAKNLKIGKNAFKRTANGITFKKGLKLSDKTRTAILESNSTAIFK